MEKYGISCNGQTKARVGQCILHYNRWYVVICKEYDRYVCTDMIDEEIREFDDYDIDEVLDYPCGFGEGI